MFREKGEFWKFEFCMHKNAATWTSKEEFIVRAIPASQEILLGRHLINRASVAPRMMRGVLVFELWQTIVT